MANFLVKNTTFFGFVANKVRMGPLRLEDSLRD